MCNKLQVQDDVLTGAHLDVLAIHAMYICASSGLANHCDPTPPHETGKQETGNQQHMKSQKNTRKYRKKYTIAHNPTATRLMTNPACRGTTKGEAADAHQTRISQITQKMNIYHIHQRINEGGRTGKLNRSGMGNILERNGEEKGE